MKPRVPACDRRHARLAVAVALALVVSPSHAAFIDWNAGTGDWFDPLNWAPPTVPAGPGGGSAGDDARINNGGTAQAIAPTTPPGQAVEARSIAVGASDAPGVVSGTLRSDGVVIDPVFGLDAGVASGDATSATGVVSVNAADLDATGATVRVGVVSQTTGTAEADGTVTVTGGGLNSASAPIGAVFFDINATTASPGATATGTVEVDGDFDGGVTAGSNVGGTTGTSATGSLIVHDGDLDPRGRLITVGRTFGPLDDALGAGSASGTVVLDNGNVTLANPLNAVFTPGIDIGVAFGGNAGGSLVTNGMDMAGNSFGDVVIGSSGSGGHAVGSLVSGGGDVVVRDEVRVGHHLGTSDGSADGFAAFGDTATVRGLDGDASSFAVGNVRSYGLIDNAGLGTATGEVHAFGVEGFDRIRVGVAEGTVQQASVAATGLLVVGGGGIGGNADGDTTMYVGASLGGPNNGMVIGEGGTAIGEVVVNGGDVTGMRAVLVGVSEAAAGTTGAGFGPATGSIEMNGGDLSTRILAVGRAAHTQSLQVDAPDVTPSADGLFVMTGGTLTVEAPPVGSIPNTATFDVGVATSFESAPAGDPDYPVNVSAIGRVQLTDVTVLGNSNLRIGTALGYDDGETVADGEVLVQGGSVTVGTLSMGSAFGVQERARARFEFTDSRLDIADNAVVGSGADATGDLIALRSDVEVGGALHVGE